MAEQIKGLSAINGELCAFSDRWKHDGDYMRCRKCSAPQITSCMDMPFPHQDRCMQATRAERPPLAQLLGNHRALESGDPTRHGAARNHPMKETGLMFKAPLVRSILDGSKTQTRRLVKPAPARDQVLRLITPPSGTPYAFSNERIDSHNLRRIRWDCQAGAPGDRIYVRETFAHGIHAMAAAREEDGPFVYAADGTTEGRLGNKWTPCLLMPKYAARIWLEITGVRVERLQQISEADCIAEGISELPHQAAERGCWWTSNVAAGAALHGRTPRNAFQLLWESTGGDWAANPWVWVIDFKRGTAQKGQP